MILLGHAGQLPLRDASVACVVTSPPYWGLRDWVLDPFAGSGTVGAVCHSTGRRFIGVELNPAYCEMAMRRTAQFGLI